MQQSDFDDFASMLNAVSELYGKPQSDMAIGMWWNALKHYDLVAIQQGFNRHVQNPDSGQFMPKPADIVKMLQGSTQDTAMLAWAKVDKAVRQVGTYRSVAFDDPIIHRVLHDMGGWIKLGSKPESEWPFIAREFENRYRGYRLRSERPEYPPVLVGMAEAHNSKEGHQSEPPMLVGDARTAMLVMQGGTTAPLVTYTQASDSAMQALRSDLRRLAA